MDHSHPSIIPAFGILVLLALLPLPSTAAVADNNEAPGITPPVISAAVPEDEHTRAALAARDRLNQTIAELETREGLYSAALSEAYLDLGNTLQTLGLHQEASEAFGHALQAQRVSGGLLDMQQIPILERQLLAQEALENWQAADASHHLIYHITLKQLPAGTPARFEALLQLARWKFKAGMAALVSDDGRGEAEAAELYKNEINAITEVTTYPEKNIHLGVLYLELAAVEYQQAKRKYLLPITDYQSSQPRTVSQLQCQLVRLPDGRVTQLCQNVDVPNMDYYLGSMENKTQDINIHLGNMKNAVRAAFELLQHETAYPADRDELLGEVQKLTNAYNAFMANNGAQ